VDGGWGKEKEKEGKQSCRPFLSTTVGSNMRARTKNKCISLVFPFIPKQILSVACYNHTTTEQAVVDGPGPGRLALGNVAAEQ
jgi:hypothetical protein